MVSMADNVSNKISSRPWWQLFIGVLVTVVATLLLTRPAASVMSMTPLSGLMTLKAMAAEAMPYETALANQKPIFIEFYADWCTTCQSMASTVNALHKAYGEQVNFVMLDIDDPQWAEQVAEFGASGVPQFTLLDGTQQSVKTWVGKVPQPVFRSVFDQIAG